MGVKLDTGNQMTTDIISEQSDWLQEWNKFMQPVKLPTLITREHWQNLHPIKATSMGRGTKKLS